MPRPKKKKAPRDIMPSPVEIIAENFPINADDALLNAIMSRPYNAATDPYVGQAQRLDAPTPYPDAIALIENLTDNDTDPGHHHDDGPYKAIPAPTPPPMRIVSNRKHSREQNFRKGTELIVSGVGLLRSTFSECNDDASPPTTTSAIWVQTEQDLRMTRLELEKAEEQIESLQSEVERYKGLAVEFKGKYLNCVTKLVLYDPSITI